MIPVGDELPTLRTPWMTYLLLGLTLGVWVLGQGAGAESAVAMSVCDWGLVPGELTRRAPLGQAVPIAPGLACVVDDQLRNVLTPVTSIFLHGGWGHILGNAVFLWVFGNNVEDSMGHWRFLAFYLLCGVAAAAAHVLVSPASPVPTVGASGAISGVLGAYLVLYPRARVRMLFIFIIFFKVIPVQAWLVLIWWFVVQLAAGVPELSAVRSASTGGVAVWAHIGGFLAGVALTRFFANPVLVAEHRAALGGRYRYGWRG